jgi:signal recognition particle subunit SRP54
MVDAMTEEERRSPDLIDRSRRQRIAAGSGTHPVEVKEFLANFRRARASRREMAQWGLWQRIKAVLGALFGPFASTG